MNYFKYLVASKDCLHMKYNYSPQGPDANYTDIVPIPFYIDGADYRHLETNVKNERDVAVNTVT